jgi:2-(3-amino-3-carboxypropyl)histidine synthase
MGLEELKKLVNGIKEEKLLVQLPAGLMPQVVEIKNALKGKDIVFSAHPCFGACDIQELIGLKMGAKAILNIGHSEIKLRTKLPVYFIEWGLPFPKIPEIKNLPKKIGLVTTVQYVKELEKFRQQLENIGHEVYLGIPGPICKYMGQVSGCDVSAASSISNEVNGYLFIGGSRFHSLKIAVDCQKPVWVIEEGGNVHKISKEDVNRELKKRAARKALALQHDTYGILVSTKVGQFRHNTAEKLKRKLEKLGKTAVIIVGNVFRSEEIGNFEVDAFVTTSCPRLVDDYEVFGKLIYSSEDF